MWFVKFEIAAFGVVLLGYSLVLYFNLLWDKFQWMHLLLVPVIVMLLVVKVFELEYLMTVKAYEDAKEHWTQRRKLMDIWQAELQILRDIDERNKKWPSSFRTGEFEVQLFRVEEAMLAYHNFKGDSK